MWRSHTELGSWGNATSRDSPSRAVRPHPRGLEREGPAPEAADGGDHVLPSARELSCPPFMGVTPSSILTAPGAGGCGASMRWLPELGVAPDWDPARSTSVTFQSAHWRTAADPGHGPSK